MNTESGDDQLIYGVISERTPRGYVLRLSSDPSISAKGTVFEEAVYYFYRVLSDFLKKERDEGKDIRDFTFMHFDFHELDQVHFLTLVSVPENLDPHKMEMTMTFPQTRLVDLGDTFNQLKALLS
ncbi:hypothetical protein [Schleiferilactobacillus perolens]|jgi:hypothetical protein|uniref:hypothetical protein n=1 Tax=Schleiferilactobacillus perolens TaxID=100468 RepID=UPI0023576FD1|nr:hypothetical protein [Schleiferilactobacillus perolens]MCI1891341.1 hypothetical protein [Schleiferilactobacillus harbinensis]MCI1912287.1 hypothetical protein [Schleiferilactobacillus harbinensis]MCI2170600.1 hypothetical protein [Schleiferilactobacillus perolens]